MLRGYLLRCTDCGYLYVCETEAMDCLTDRVCEHCGSSDMEVIQQAEGRFGCTSRLNTHVDPMTKPHLNSLFCKRELRAARHSDKVD